MKKIIGGLIFGPTPSSFCSLITDTAATFTKGVNISINISHIIICPPKNWSRIPNTGSVFTKPTQAGLACGWDDNNTTLHPSLNHETSTTFFTTYSQTVPLFMRECLPQQMVLLGLHVSRVAADWDLWRTLYSLSYSAAANLASLSTAKNPTLARKQYPEHTSLLLFTVQPCWTKSDLNTSVFNMAYSIHFMAS